MAGIDPYGSIVAGELRHPIKVMKNVITRSPTGAEIPVPTPVFPSTVWARIEPLQGNERFVAQQAFPNCTTRITIRGMLARYITVEMWVLFRDRVFDINDIGDVDLRYRTTILTTTERPANRNVV